MALNISLAAVFINLKIRRAINCDSTVGIYGHHRHFAQHVGKITGRSLGIGLDVVAYTVDFFGYERFLGHHLEFTESILGFGH